MGYCNVIKSRYIEFFSLLLFHVRFELFTKYNARSKRILQRLGQSLESLEVGPGFITSACTGILKHILLERITFSAQILLEGPWSCIKVMCQTLLSPLGKSYPL